MSGRVERDLFTSVFIFKEFMRSLRLVAIALGIWYNLQLYSGWEKACNKQHTAHAPDYKSYRIASGIANAAQRQQQRAAERGMKDGRWLNWSKMQYTHMALDKTKTTIHYLGKWKNGVLKAVDDFKYYHDNKMFT